MRLAPPPARSSATSPCMPASASSSCSATSAPWRRLRIAPALADLRLTRLWLDYTAVDGSDRARPRPGAALLVGDAGGAAVSGEPGSAAAPVVARRGLPRLVQRARLRLCDPRHRLRLCLVGRSAAPGPCPGDPGTPDRDLLDMARSRERRRDTSLRRNRHLPAHGGYLDLDRRLGRHRSDAGTSASAQDMRVTRSSVILSAAPYHHERRQ